MDGNSKKRESSLELMRIVAMLMVCAFHWQLHGMNDGIVKAPLSANQIVSFVLGSWGILGVNLFFLLSFYFMVSKETVNYKKIFSLIVKVSVYGTGVLFLAYIFNITDFNPIDTVKSVLGVFAYQYWFITVYIIVALLSPYINRMLGVLTRKEVLVVWTIQFYATYIVSWFLGNELVGRLSCGLTIYTTIYILKNGIIKNYFQKYRYLGVVLFIGAVGMESCFSYFGTMHPIFYKLIEKTQTTASPYMFFLSLFIFYCFKELKIGYISFVNKIAIYSSGAYLLHGGAGFIKNYLWDGLFRAAEYYQKSVVDYTIHYIICILLLFIAGVVVECLYSYSVDKAVNKMYLKLSELVNKWKLKRTKTDFLDGGER